MICFNLINTSANALRGKDEKQLVICFSAIVIVSLLASLFASSKGCYSRDLILKADGPVPIYTTKDAALSGKASSMLSKGQQVPIQECMM